MRIHAFTMGIILAGLTAAAPMLTQNAAAQTAQVETLASFPHGNFLENLAVDTDGTVYFTSYFARSVMKLGKGAEATPLATLDVHPVGIVQTAEGFIVTAHAIPFTKAPDFLSSNKILVLGRDGAVRRTIDAPDARFLNGLVALSPDKVLIADSAAGLIWALTPSSGDLRVWLSSEELTADPKATSVRPAANGLKLHDGQLYVSNSSRGAIYRLPLTEGGEPGGQPVAFVQPGPIDDFAFAADGSIYAATHGPKLLRIAPDASVATVIETGCDACTSVAVTGTAEKPALVVLTTGNLLEGGDTPARVLQIGIAPNN